MKNQQLLTKSEAARYIGVTPAHVRYLSETGELPAAIRTENGTRLFRKDTVIEFAVKRQQRSK